MTRGIVTIGLTAALVAGVSALQEQKLGAGVVLTTATPIAALYETPEKFVGQTIRLDGVVTSVCQEMGCWMALGAEPDSEQTVRFKVDHGSAIVFPAKSKGRRASAEGVFERIAKSDHEGHEAAAEHARSLPKASDFAKTYQIKVTGALLK